MSNTRHMNWLFLILFLLAGSGWYYTHHSTVIHLDKDTLANTVETSVFGLRVKQFDGQGKLVNSLISPKVEHIQKNDKYIFQNPEIQITQEQSPWHISSKTGVAIDGGKKIIFSGNVIVQQFSENKQQLSVLKTEAITYYPSEKKASTDLLVTFEQPGNVLQSVGMNAYLEQKRVELLHKASGSYLPKNG